MNCERKFIIRNNKLKQLGVLPYSSITFNKKKQNETMYIFITMKVTYLF